jgi:hypothetical protein
LIVAGSTPSDSRESLYSSIHSAEMSDNRAPVNAAFNFPTEDPYRLRVLGCVTFARKSSAHFTKTGGADFGSMKTAFKNFCFPSHEHLTSKPFIAGVGALADLLTRNSYRHHPIVATSAFVKSSHLFSSVVSTFCITHRP